jgi:hypothetical protein
MPTEKDLLKMFEVSDAVDTVFDHDLVHDGFVDHYRVTNFLRKEFPRAGKRFVSEVIAGCEQKAEDVWAVHENLDRAAKQVGEELRAAFPDDEFKIGKNHPHLTISWCDGPSVNVIKPIVDKYELREPAARADWCLPMFTRTQVCPDCACDVISDEPTEPEQLRCYVCGKNGGLDEPAASNATSDKQA